jgi:glycosyltransferase involved in cell wall biosynthesis
VSILATSPATGDADGSVYDVAAAWTSRSPSQRLADGLRHRLDPELAVRRRLGRALVATARRLEAERGVQVVDMEESFGYPSLLAEGTALAVCVRLHGPWFLNGPAVGEPDDAAFRRRVRDEGAGIAAAHGVSAPSLDVLQKVRARYGIALPEAEVIPNPIAAVPSGERWRLEGSDRRRVLFVGRFDRHKGGDLVIEAFGRVLRRVPDARLWFVGPDRGCVDDDGRTWSLEEFVRARVPGALEAGRVEILGPQPASAIPPLRRQALVTVVASRYENFPYTVSEAMAAGCPVVAAGTGGIPEVVEDGDSGLLHLPGDAADLGEKIVALLEDPALAARLGGRAAARCEQLLHADVVASRMADFYGRAVDRRARR